MTEIVKGTDLTDREKRMLFWASFLSLTAAGFGFAFRIAKQGDYGREFTLTYQEVGQIMGASFWPIAVTMIGFSLVVDKIGYKKPMYAAFALQALSGVLFFFANGYESLYYASIFAGLGHGVVEAVINPVCAAVYPKEKTKWLTILHAAWPAGVAGGTLLIMGANAAGFESWRLHGLWILLPTLAYAFMYGPCRFPTDERVQAGVPFREMLQQVGFLSSALASTLIIHELGNAMGFASGDWLQTSVIAGLVFGAVFGFAVKSFGRPLFFALCLLMIPVATAELATDGWIQKLMGPALDGLGISVGYAIVFSAGVMLILRVFAGSILQHFSPPGLLALSGLLSAVGLAWLSGAAGPAVFFAFLIYAVGQTYYWPCILGFTAERYPQGGALTLNTVSAMGLLSLGVIGAPILGVAFDTSIHGALNESEPEFVEYATTQNAFLGRTHAAIDPAVLIPSDLDDNENTILDREEHVAGLGEDAKERVAAGWAWMDALDEATETRVRDSFRDEDEAAGRSVLMYAVRFPALLVIAFGLIWLWFRSRGGYRPVTLEELERLEEADPGV